MSKRDGVRLLRLSTFSHRGQIKVCVDGPASGDECRNFSLKRKKHDIYEIDVRWSKYFENEGSGTYKVSFSNGGSRLGPKLSFRVG